MKKRVFIGVKASNRLLLFVENWIRNNPWLLDNNFRLVEHDDLHLTLIPPWYESDINKIIYTLEDKIIFKPFKIAFDTISVGPEDRNPRLIWLKAKSNSDLLILKSDLEKYLDKPSMSKKFVPHITIIRFNKGVNHLRLDEKITFEENICSFSIFESRLSSRGVSYKVIETFKFRN